MAIPDCVTLDNLLITLWDLNKLIYTAKHKAQAGLHKVCIIISTMERKPGVVIFFCLLLFFRKVQLHHLGALFLTLYDDTEN